MWGCRRMLMYVEGMLMDVDGCMVVYENVEGVLIDVGGYRGDVN